MLLLSTSLVIMVRLVRACGSKPETLHRPKHIILVRLVRACGSKQPETPEDILASIGQARKSLWIETNVVLKDSTYTLGSGS